MDIDWFLLASDVVMRTQGRLCAFLYLVLGHSFTIASLFSSPLSQTHTSLHSPRHIFSSFEDTPIAAYL